MTKDDVQHRHDTLIEHGLQHVLSSEAGRAWYLDLITKCGFFTADSLDVNLQFFSAGKRNIGLMLYGQAAEIDRDSFLKMVQEDVNRKKEIDNVTNTSKSTDSNKPNAGEQHAFDTVTAAGHAASSGLV